MVAYPERNETIWHFDLVICTPPQKKTFFLPIVISGFLPGIFQGGKICCYANFFCYANSSIVFGPNFRGAKVSGGRPLLPCGRKPDFRNDTFIHNFQIFPPFNCQSVIVEQTDTPCFTSSG